MTKKFSALLLCSILFAFQYAPAQAWEATGHRVVARVVDRYLSPKARRGVENLLSPGENLPDISVWADEFRGAGARSAAGVQALLLLGSAYLRRRVGETVGDPALGFRGVHAELDAFQTLGDCRKSLAQRNANPQMVAERALLVLREACAR